ncbi:MAG: glucose-1-phosphate adenylyltransferase [Burkholderiales bacterium]
MLFRDDSPNDDTGLDTPDALARQTLALVLAGGRGSRLGNLTDGRAKPAVPFGGQFRIIDFALSNAINSGIRRIGVLTQYKAQSLIRHLQTGFGFLDRRMGEFVEILPAQQRLHASWYAGTADAVFQNLNFIAYENPRFVLVLAGDHVYKMDYRKLLADHVAYDAEVTVACIDAPVDEARAYGVMHVAADMRVVAFEEKPVLPKSIPGRPDTALASMGIYVFNTAYLRRVLAHDAQKTSSSHDFGSDVLPALVRNDHRVFAHAFSKSCAGSRDRGRNGGPYWRDVGTIDAYWTANMELIQPHGMFEPFDPDWPIMSAPEHAPSARFITGDTGPVEITDSIIGAGGSVCSAKIRRSVVFANVEIDDGSRIDEAVILPEVKIGRGSILRRVVIDKRCTLPPGFVAGVDSAFDRERFHVTPGGITLITQSMINRRSNGHAVRREAA